MQRLFVLLSLLAASVSPAKDLSFHASSLNSPFSIAGEVTGTCDLESDEVVVTVNNGHLVRQPCPYTGERKVTKISAFLAGRTRDGRTFEPYVSSAPVEIGKSLVLGETFSLDGPSLSFR
jgi:hypothetical protein